MNDMTEKDKRDAAVHAFAAEMIKRLDAKAAAGYTGWDGAYSAEDCRTDLYEDADDMELNDDDSKAVDTANRAMFLWYRDNNKA